MSTHKYKVIASDEWLSEMQELFGDNGSFVDLTDEEVIEAIIVCGRASIDQKIDHRIIEFNNDYD